MLIQAIVTKGQFQLLQPVQFAHDQVHVMVDIPDEEIVGLNDQQAVVVKPASSVLIKQLWATRKQAPSNELDLLDGIEKKYE